LSIQNISSQKGNNLPDLRGYFSLLVKSRLEEVNAMALAGELPDVTPTHQYRHEVRLTVSSPGYYNPAKKSISTATESHCRCSCFPASPPAINPI